MSNFLLDARTYKNMQIIKSDGLFLGERKLKFPFKYLFEVSSRYFEIKRRCVRCISMLNVPLLQSFCALTDDASGQLEVQCKFLIPAVLNFP